MILNKLKAYAALSASWIGSAAFVYAVYWITEPIPIMNIKFIYDPNTHGSNAAVAGVTSANKYTLREFNATHKNLDCLQDKGYIVKHLCMQSDEPMIYIQNAADRFSISDDCAACRVATEIEYKTAFGGRHKKVLKWAPYSSDELIRVTPHPIHKQQNPPAQSH